MEEDDSDQSLNVYRFHNFPRFGHTNQLSSLADPEEKEEYIDGVLGFLIFTLCFFAVWTWTLMILKCCAGVEYVGCAAGGEAIDIPVLREKGVRRWQRRKRIERSWRIQVMFAIASFGLITFSFVFVNHGLTPFVESLQDVTTTTNIVRTRLLEGMHLTHLVSSHMASLQPYVDLDVKSLCPNYEETILASEYSLAVTSDEIRNALQQMLYFVDEDAFPLLSGIDHVAGAFSSVASHITTVEENDWLLRLTLVIVNIVNIFMFFGVVLTRNKINSYFYQSVLGAMFVPAFSVAIIFVVIVLCILAVIAMVNADFCMGGGSSGGPIATLAAFVTTSGYHREGFISRTLDYYTTNQCDGPNPLMFLYDLEVTLVETSGRVADLTRSFQAADSEQLTDACQADFSIVNKTFSALAPILSDVAESVTRLNGLIKCEEVNPILNEFERGPICEETINAATWMYYTWLVIALLIMIMLSTRAALFNGLIPAPPKKRREKEFRQYKRFMREHGFNTDDWQLDPPKKVDSLEKTQTCDTEESESDIRVTPEPRDESSEFSFDDEYVSKENDETIEPQGLETLPETTDEYDDQSVSSKDSDDSSLNGPPTVMSQVASSVTSSVSSALKRVVRARTSSSSLNISYDTDENYGRAPLPFQTPPRRTPRSTPQSILGPMPSNGSRFDPEFDDEEKIPLSPSPKPLVAPKKSLKHLRRTRGSTNLTFD